VNIPICIIVGSTRSGNTILARVLNTHPRIAKCIEPYYIWDHYFREAQHDELSAADANGEVRSYIRRSFIRYWKALQVDCLVDKSPRNCLKIPFVKSVFPEARYIFNFRDGRDTILSMINRLETKKKIFEKDESGRRWFEKLHIFMRRMGKNPLWRFRFQTFLFEFGPPRYWFKRRFLQQIRWSGRFAVGPRFKGWHEIIDIASPLEFCAYQWVHCARGMIESLPLIPEDRRFVLKYEDFIDNPKAFLEKIFSFLDVEFPKGFMDMIPEIWKGNYDLWRGAFSTNDLKLIGPIIGKSLIDLGYEKDESWYLDLK